ncbi:MAG TPA: hypothetical protein ENJ53_03555 [Phaeodactylibacter sp.]|nr:hypothetical protein [Phaeodactylibacter sp.]
MTKQKNIYIKDLHFEHERWLREIDFWKDELKIFADRLGEIVSRWTDHSVLAKAEHFQNQFIRHNEVVDKLKHDIKAKENTLVDYAIAHPVAINHVHFSDHVSLRDRMETQEKIYNDLKGEFFRYMTEVM